MRHRVVMRGVFRAESRFELNLKLASLEDVPPCVAQCKRGNGAPARRAAPQQQLCVQQHLTRLLLTRYCHRCRHRCSRHCWVLPLRGEAWLAVQQQLVHQRLHASAPLLPRRLQLPLGQVIAWQSRWRVMRVKLRGRVSGWVGGRLEGQRALECVGGWVAVGLPIWGARSTANVLTRRLQLAQLAARGQACRALRLKHLHPSLTGGECSAAAPLRCLTMARTAGSHPTWSRGSRRRPAVPS